MSNLGPLRYHGHYVAIILLIYSIGATMGAFVGGIIVDQWWAFYINLPIRAVSLLIVFFLLYFHYHSKIIDDQSHEVYPLRGQWHLDRRHYLDTHRADLRR